MPEDEPLWMVSNIGERERIVTERWREEVAGRAAADKRAAAAVRMLRGALGDAYEGDWRDDAAALVEDAFGLPRYWLWADISRANTSGHCTTYIHDGTRPPAVGQQVTVHDDGEAHVVVATVTAVEGYRVEVLIDWSSNPIGHRNAEVERTRLRAVLDEFEARHGLPSERRREAFAEETDEFHEWDAAFVSWQVLTEADGA